MFRTVPLSIIRSFSLYTQQWYMSYSLRVGSGRNFPVPARRLSANLYDIYHNSSGIYHTGLLTACEQDQDGTILILLASCQQTCMYCYVYSEKLLMMDRGTVRNM